MLTSDIYRFTVGTIGCIVVSDGAFVYPSSAFAANVPVERFEQELQDHNLPQRELDIPYSCFFVNTGTHRVLVDTGAGFAPTNGKLLQNLAAAGIKAGNIDTVVLTHGHADHIGANVDDAGRPSFPNARYVMWKEEWDFWTQEQPDLRALPVEEQIKQLLVAYAQRELPPLKGQIDLIDRETEIVPGIRALPAPGHTPGHMVLSITSGTEQLLHVVDTVLHPILTEQPDWYPGFDLLPEQAIATKRRLLDQAATDGVLVAAYHFPFPGIGHVVRWGKGWRWQPIAVAAPTLVRTGA
jgi:glyoxylase-like metal-dependent hydrolase (beta-lactamase superfamily II)